MDATDREPQDAIDRELADLNRRRWQHGQRPLSRRQYDLFLASLDRDKHAIDRELEQFNRSRSKDGLTPLSRQEYVTVRMDLVKGESPIQSELHDLNTRRSNEGYGNRLNAREYVALVTAPGDEGVAEVRAVPREPETDWSFLLDGRAVLRITWRSDGCGDRGGCRYLEHPTADISRATLVIRGTHR